ncbi:serine-rich adhesin for platelets isoform X2 [Lucilia sericata]|uniref:serine-rich adhesin for platelets isoform X2 n=1 Tax=Lucilia sericata TaxID=13632 RepID=UPI0018A811FB|nr:serine-rich adhesin for platelets isoform X2 [Lucilia sericata]
MSSFVNDNVSESKKQEQQITENQENSEETTTETKTSTTTAEKNNQSEKATISNNDNKVNNKSNETNDENRKTIIHENKSEKISEDRKLTKTTTTTNNFDNNDVVVATVDKDKQKDKHDDVATALGNNENLNKQTDVNKLTTAQINTSAAAASSSAALSAATCCLSNMPAGDVEQHQQQQVATIDNKQTTATSNTHSNTLPTTTEISNEEANSMKQLPTEVESNVKSLSTTLPATAAETATVTSPLPPLPPALNTPIAGSHLPHICSEPTFGVQLRNRNTEDQQQNKSNSPTKASGSGNSARDWRPNTSALNYSSVIKSGTVSASASPNMVRKTSDSSVLLPRRVSFPKSDNELVTGYLEPANPWEHVCMVKSISEIAELYITSCQKHNTKPLQSILDHLKAVDLTKQLRRQPLLSLKSIKLAPSDCEALEEVLKRVQYKSIDLSDCKLDEAAASALFDMIEYYEAAHELDISSNAAGMTHRSWISCTYMISHSQELQVLNAEGNPISKLSADLLGNALSTSNLHTLKLEHCGLKGAPLSGLCYKLFHNKVLKELWLAHNDLDCHDADTIAGMLKCNHYIELIDISNNNIRDEGLRHIVKALIMQSIEMERRTTFQRTAAIDDDGDGECMSPVESSPPVDLADKGDNATLDWNAKKDQQPNETQSLKATSKSSDLVSESNMCKETPSILPSIEEKVKGVAVETGSDDVVHEQHKVKPPLISSVGSTIDENDGDEDTDDTVRSSTIRNPLQSTSGGQSMLDKLLSMNSESSSEDGASNLSTDTLAACNSEDASLISDEIFDSAATTTTSTSTNTKAPTNTLGLEVTSLSEGTVTLTSAIVNPTSTASSEGNKDGKEIAIVFQNSPRECPFIAGNNVTLDETNVVLVNSPVNLSNTANIQNTLVINNNNNNNNNNNSTPQTINMPLSSTHTSCSPAFSNIANDQNVARSGVFEVTAEESDCLVSGGSVSRVAVGDDVDMRTGDHSNVMQHHAASRALDVNKNTKLGEDFDDTHSTDSAFESASEGDISRHLPEEFTRLSTSLESTRFDEIAKELAIETATIASESNECLIAAAAQVTPSSTPTPPTPPFTNLSTPLTERERLAADSPINSCLSSSLPTVTTTTPPTVQVGFVTLEEPTEPQVTTANEVRDKIPKVTIAQESLTQKYKSNSTICTSPSPTPTPPPPSTSPGGASSGLRRTESNCGFLTQSSRNRSQSTDSLCSDNSLDGSIGSGDLNFSSSSNLNEKITKNDTLTRQQRPMDATPELGTRTPGGLKALAVWNNNLTKESGLYISDLLAETVSLELLNIGKNCLSNDFVTTIKESLTKNTTLTTLGLQSAHLSAKGIETLSSILTFGGNSTLQRIDIRDNKLEVESLTKIAEVLKSNTTVTQIDIDDEPKRLSVGSEAHLDYARVLENVRSMCSRNEKTQAQIQQEKSAANVMGKRRGGYYLGSRKISLTCQSRPVVDTTKNVVVSVSNSKLDIKRKTGTRLRSPVPSPTTISPSSSPNRASRFQVFRVPEASPLTSPNTQKPIGNSLVAAKAVSMSSAAIPLSSATERGGNDPIYQNITSTSLPTSCSLPSMATISSSTQSIKRLSVSPRSRFLVRKVYEDPNLPLTSRFTQPITPPINPPPTPISRNAKESLTGYLETTPPTQSHKRTDERRQDSLISGSSSITTAAQVTPPTTFVTPPPTIITPQQEFNTTTETSATINTTPILKLHRDTSAMKTPAEAEISSGTRTTTTIQQCEQSTNNTITNDNNITNQTQTSTTTPAPLSTTPVTVPISSNNLQPSPSLLSTLSSSSDSSTSSSSSSSSSTSPASNTDSSDSSISPVSSVHSNEALSKQQQHDLTGSGQCPIAVFSDNDITLTKNTVNEVFGPVAAAAAAAAARENIGNIVETSNENIMQPAAQQQEPQQQQQRRSSSPESKPPVASSTTNTAATQLSQSPPTYAEAAAAAVLAAQQQQKSQTSLVPLRKQSPPSWTKLGNDIITAAATNNVDLANTVATTAAAVVTEQSRSFFDAAKQLRDFSKQVFRQNLSFGNEPVTTASTSSTTMTTASALNVQPTASESNSGMLLGRAGEYCGCGCVGTATGCLCGTMLTTECNADCIPTDVKQEIKENISPEHTINEETLHKMQKLYGSSAAITTAAATINFEPNDDNNETTIIDSPATAAAVTPPPPTTTTQIQHSTVAATSGIESELPAHNT